MNAQLLDDLVEAAYAEGHEDGVAGIAPRPKIRTPSVEAAIAAIAVSVIDPSWTVLAEHSGCGYGTQVDQITVRVNRGDKVVLIPRAALAAPKEAGASWLTLEVVEKLQAALNFWLPCMGQVDEKWNDRIGNDACLLMGFVGKGMDEPTYYDLLAANPPGDQRQEGCGACGDGCANRGRCHLADESPAAPPAPTLLHEHEGDGVKVYGYTQADLNAEYTRGRCDGFDAASPPTEAAAAVALDILLRPLDPESAKLIRNYIASLSPTASAAREGSDGQ